MASRGSLTLADIAATVEQRQSATYSLLAAGPKSRPAAGAREVSLAPVGEGGNGLAERAALTRERIGVAARMFVVRDSVDEAFLLQPLQAVGQDVGRDVLLGFQELAEAVFAG